MYSILSSGALVPASCGRRVGGSDGRADSRSVGSALQVRMRATTAKSDANDVDVDVDASSSSISPAGERLAATATGRPTGRVT